MKYFYYILNVPLIFCLLSLILYIYNYKTLSQFGFLYIQTLSHRLK